jgi:hypothetical protein
MPVGVTSKTYRQGCTNPGRQVARSTKFCTVASNICGLLLQVTLLAPRILGWLLDFGGICLSLFIVIGVAVAQLVEALSYKPERRGFDSRWCH